MISDKTGNPLREELPLLIGIVAIGLAFGLEHTLIAAGRAVSLLGVAVVVATIVMVSMRVAHHAELLAHRVGEPYGTLILTVSAVLVEVLILAILVLGSDSPTLVRDTIFSAVMLDINGLLGVAAILGGLRHGEQKYNDDSGRTYVVMILTAMGISMVVPEFIPEANRHAYSVFTIVAMLGLYALFLRNQIGRHSYFFAYAYPRDRNAEVERRVPQRSLGFSVGVLVAGVVVIGLLAEAMSALFEGGLEGTGVPIGLMAVLVAAISAAPEIMTAIRAALANHMQAVINIALGASLSTVILTVPVMEAISLISGHRFVMSMTPVQTTMAIVTLITAAINLSDGRTNTIEGLTHFVLFTAFITLTVMGL
ncbi:MAG: calcium:proton antiporter [Bauldia sp.]